MLHLKSLALLVFLQIEVGLQNSWNFQKGWYSGSDADVVDKLPEVITVLRYDIWLKPYFQFPGFTFHASKRLTFEGKVSITFVPLKNTSSFQFNSAGLQINQVDVWVNETRLKTTIKVERFKPIVNLVVDEGEELEANTSYVMKIQYTGKIQHKQIGALYYNDYVAERNIQRTMLATLMEPSKAHKVFPCLDFPTYKSIFQLTLTHPTKAKVFHNTFAEETTEISDQLSTTIFKETPKMSTYLFAFAIGDFVTAESKSKSGVKVRTIALKQYGDYLPQSVEIASQCINSLEDILGVKFPLEKLDHLESPDSLVGGMENLGLIIYRGLLSVPPNVSSSMKLTQKLMICHEVSHQWFSGLVTATKFNLMFLHESVAQFLMYKAVRKMTKNVEDKNLIDSAFVDEREHGLKEMDRLSHSIIDEHTYFDVITYKAGASFIKMLESVLGVDAFYKGLQIYLKKHQYSNADHNDLIQSLEQATKNKSLCNGITIRSFMQDYLFRPSYPILQVDLTDTLFDFKQRASDNSKLKWDIPIFMQNLETNKEGLIWLKKDGSLCGQFRPSNTDTYIFNTKGRGLMRVEYSESIWLKFIEKAGNIDATSQYAMVLDLLNSNERPMAQAFFQQIVTQTGTLSPLLSTQIKNIFNVNDLTQIVEQVCNNTIDFYPKTLSQGYLTHNILRLAVEQKLCGVSVEVDKMLKNFLNNCFGTFDFDKCNKLNGDVREAVYCYAVKNRHFPTMSNYLFWLNSSPKLLQFEYDEIPNVRHAFKCR